MKTTWPKRPETEWSSVEPGALLTFTEDLFVYTKVEAVDRLKLIHCWHGLEGKKFPVGTSVIVLEFLHASFNCQLKDCDPDKWVKVLLDDRIAFMCTQTIPFNEAITSTSIFKKQFRKLQLLQRKRQGP